jgi:hypothetical protein
MDKGVVSKWGAPFLLPVDIKQIATQALAGALALRDVFNITQKEN